MEASLESCAAALQGSHSAIMTLYWTEGVPVLLGFIALAATAFFVPLIVLALSQARLLTGKTAVRHASSNPRQPLVSGCMRSTNADMMLDSTHDSDGTLTKHSTANAGEHTVMHQLLMDGTDSCHDKPAGARTVLITATSRASEIADPSSAFDITDQSTERVVSNCAADSTSGTVATAIHANTAAPSRTAALTPWQVLRRVLSDIQALWLWPLMAGNKTSITVMAYRNLPRALHRPTANNDHLAQTFLEQAAPFQAWMAKYMPVLLRVQETSVQHPIFGCPGVIRYIDVRTRWMDGVVEHAIKKGVKQVVIIAAGYDSRAYRMSVPGGPRFFEVDLPTHSKVKHELMHKVLPDLHKSSLPVYIAADLSRVPLSVALRSCPSFSAQLKTLYIAEGLVYYLPQSAVDGLFAAVGDLASSGSMLAFDFLDQDVLTGRKWIIGYEAERLTVQLKGEPNRSGLPADPSAMAHYLQSFGLKQTAMPSMRRLAAAMYPDLGWHSWCPVLPEFWGFVEAQKL